MLGLKSIICDNRRGLKEWHNHLISDYLINNQRSTVFSNGRFKAAYVSMAQKYFFNLFIAYYWIKGHEERHTDTRGDIDDML